MSNITPFAGVAGHPTDGWLTKREAATRARCSNRTLERAMRDRTLRYTRTNGGLGDVRIRACWLDDWLEGRAPMGDDNGGEDT